MKSNVGQGRQEECRVTKQSEMGQSIDVFILRIKFLYEIQPYRENNFSLAIFLLFFKTKSGVSCKHFRLFRLAELETTLFVVEKWRKVCRVKNISTLTLACQA